jgi:hypothetical protein
MFGLFRFWLVYLIPILGLACLFAGHCTSVETAVVSPESISDRPVASTVKLSATPMPPQLFLVLGQQQTHRLPSSVPQRPGRNQHL